MPRIRSKTDFMLHYAPEEVADADIVIPGKKVKSTNLEWKLQASVAKLCRQYERINKDFWWMAPGAHQVATDPRRAAFAKMVGYRKGIIDIWLVKRLHPGYKIETVELKREGGRLTPEQEQFFIWSPWPCHKVDSLGGFAKVLVDFLAPP